MSTIRRTLVLKNIFVALLGFTLAGQVFAESDEDQGYFEEIVVTAERTEKSVMDTAMTITGSQDTLKLFGIQDRDSSSCLSPVSIR